MVDDSFGFSKAKPTADKLKAFKPSPAEPEPTPHVIAKADAAGAKVGFPSRENEPVTVARRHKRELGPTTTINTRAPQWVAKPFIEFCEENRMAYWEGIEELMKRAGLIS